MTNKTNMRIPKKYEKFISEVWYEGQDDGYWADLLECCICDDTESHYVHEWTQKDFLKSLQSIKVASVDEYISHFGEDNLDDYYADLKRLESIA